MSEVMPRDILLRISPKMLEKYQSLAVAGAGRGRAAPLPYTFTRGSTLATRGFDGVGRKFAANKVAIEYPAGLVDADGNQVAGIRLNGARTQLVTDPENFGAWTMNGTAVRASGFADPFGGLAAYRLSDDDVAAWETLSQVVAFTGDGTKSIALFIHKDTATLQAFGLLDNTAVVWRPLLTATWNADGTLASVALSSGSGTVLATEPWSAGWYRVLVQCPGVVAANTNLFFVSGSGSTNSNTGDGFVFGANAWNAPFPSSYQGPSGGASPSVKDSLTVPFNFGPMDLTVLARIARPSHADITGSMGFSPRIYEIGNTAPFLRAFFNDTTRQFFSQIDTTVTDGSVGGLAIPSGAELTYLTQWRNLVAGGQAAHDAGSVLSAFGSTASGFAKFGEQTLHVGSLAGEELYGVLLDLIIARGLFTRVEMLAIP